MSIWSRIERRIGDFANELLPDEFSEALDSARELVEDKRYTEAEVALQGILQNRPEHFETGLLLGLVHLRLGKLESAVSLLDRVLVQQPNEPIALVGRGEAALAQGATADALPYFRKAVDSAQGDTGLLADAYRGLGIAYRRAGNLDKAIRELRKAAAMASNDPETIAALGEALCADSGRSNEEARRSLKRLAEREGCPTMAWLTLGAIAIADEDSDDAIEYFRRVIAAGAETAQQTRAFVGIGDAELLKGDGGAAETAYAQALELDSRDSVIRTKLGEAKLQQNDHSGAMRCYQEALAQDNSVETAKKALALALRSGDIGLGVVMANRVLEEDARNGDALTARGLQLYEEGNTEAALATYREVLQGGENLETLLALTRATLAAGTPKEAIGFVQRALRFDTQNPRVLQLLAQCRAAELGVDLQADSNWYDLAMACSRLCASHPALVEYVQDAAIAVAEYDQPLLVAVMGEFSSGKSTFVNAFVDAQVAPTGIIPTTATINILRYGRTPSGRVVYRDNSSRDIDGDTIAQSLSQIDDAEARRVQHVEILMPMEILKRVNIIDTPGLNSILPEHEAVARAFLQRADAVIWLFTVNQAGKTTEKRALDSIREHGVRVMGVLNKTDLLGDEQVAEVLTYVEGELAGKVEVCMPISALRQQSADPAMRAESGWGAMHAELETRFFQEARLIKSQALNRRLASVLSRAKHEAQSRVVENDNSAKELRSASEKCLSRMLEFVESVVERERATINQELGLLYREAAREILELVQPRTVPFGSHKAAPADRDYLLGLLESGCERILDTSQQRVSEDLVAATADILTPIGDVIADAWRELDELVNDGLYLVRATVYEAALAFYRGYLRGGFVDHFFAVDLPKIVLSTDALYHALFRAAPIIDTEISIPMAKAGSQVLESLGTRLSALADIRDIQTLESDAGLKQALDALDEHRIRLSQNH